MKTKLLTLMLFVATAGIIAAYPSEPSLGHTTPPKAQTKPIVEAVFVLDTTGSMSGLIDGAKENIWSIIRTMAAAQPAPDVRIGLVAYRDRGDDYVTKTVPLSGDLDSVYAQLMDFQAVGGGDTPESVNAGLDAALHQMQWSQQTNAYRVVFLVGDAPAHTDYPGERQYADLVTIASRKGITVNTILCGNNSQAQQQWQRIAQLNQGQFFRVGQTGNAIALSTPYDRKLAELSRQLDNTRVFYGDDDAQQKAATKIASSNKLHRESTAAAQAKRATFNASGQGKKNFLGEQELVEDVASGRVSIDELDQAQLPASLKPLAPEVRKKVLAEKAEQREKLREEIQALASKRDADIQRQLAKQKDKSTSLDFQLYDTIKAQAERKGLRYDEEGPKL